MTTDDRVLILMPTVRDGERTRNALAGVGLGCAVCKDVTELCHEIGRGAGAALLTEEAVVSDRDDCLQEALRGQPPWSDFPLVVLAREGAEARGHLLRESMNATLVERPLKIRSLLSVLRAALRSRRRQYEVRDHLAERERQAVALEESEQNARQLLEFHQAVMLNMGEGLYAVDTQGQVTYLNSAAEALFGWTRAELLGRKMHDVTHYKHPDGTPFPTEECAGLRVLRQGTPLRDYHDVFIRKDGTFFPVVYSSAPLLTDGRTVGLVVVFRDVTKQKRAEEDQARLAAIVESSVDAIISKSLDGTIRSWNAGAERLFGYTPDEAIGQFITLIIPPGRLVEERDILARLRRGECIEHFETVRVAKDGRRINLSLTVSPLRNGDGQVVGASKVARDITDKKRAHTELARLAETLGLALSAAGLGTWEWDPATDLITLSDRAAAIYGLPPGRTYLREWMRGLVRPDYRDRIREEAARAVADRSDYDVEYPLERAGDAPVWVAARGRGVYDAAGTLTRMLGVTQDVTQRKRTEQEREQLVEALRESDQKKDDFIALLAHELRNPLAPIRNGLQDLRLAGGDVDAVGDARAMMDRQLSHMVRLIDDLLDVSRISRNKMELRRERVLLGDVIGSAVETARPLIEAAGHDLSASMPPGPVFLDADLTRLAQVFSNLLTNSAKYTGRGGKIRLAAERRGGEVVVTVRDNGIGIPAAALGNIFDMFSQVDRSVERSTGGLGIGLALVKGLVEMHGGTVTAASEGEGKGSAFTVRLPTVEGRPAPLKPGFADHGQHGPGRRVLVVDDNRDGAVSMAMMLRLMGDEVRTAHDGVEAVEVAEQFHPEVILMDVGMPRLNGLDATKRIREQPWGEGMTIIALTGWGQDGDKERSREAGCNGHLVKASVNLPGPGEVAGGGARV